MSRPKANQASPLPGGGRFAATRWSIVVAAGRDEESQSNRALATLCEDYWFPLYAFVR